MERFDDLKSGLLWSKINRRQFMARAAALGVGSSAIAAALAACAPAAPTAAPPDTETEPTAPQAVSGGQFVYVDGTDAVTMDPHASPDIHYTFLPLRGPHEPLVQYHVTDDGQVTIAPRLAKSWHSEDARVWDFELNEGVEFTDGAPCNAEAIKWNFERIRAMNLGPAGRLGPVESVEALNETTFRLTLPGPNADILNYLTMLLMVSPKALQDNESGGDLGQGWAAENVAPGTGPFLIRSRIVGSETIMERNPDYWRGWDGNHVDSVVIRIVREAATRRLLIEGGEGSLANNIAAADLPALQANPDLNVAMGQTPGVQSAACRFRGPLNDVNVRRALTWAFDRQGFVDSVLQGLGEVPRGPLHTEFRFHNPAMPLLLQDLDRAKEYLAASEYPNGGFDLSLMILPSFAFFQTGMAQIFQENLKELNINLEIVPMAELATYYASVEDEVNGDDMWSWSSASQTPDYNFQARRQWHSAFKRPRGVNGGYANPRVDALLEEDMQTLDMDRRRAIWYEVQEILMDELPFVPFAIPSRFWVTRKNLAGAPFNVYDYVPDYYAVHFTS